MKKICILLALILALACADAFAAEGDAILGLSSEANLSFSYCFAFKRHFDWLCRLYLITICVYECDVYCFDGFNITI